MTEFNLKTASQGDMAAQAEQRALISASLDVGGVPAVIQDARCLLQEQPSFLNFRFIRQLVTSLPPEETVLKPWRVALLSSFTIEFIHDSLIAYGFTNGLRIEIYQPGFGLIRQELLNPTSALYQFMPNVTILAIEGEDWLPEIYTTFMDTDPPGQGLGDITTRFQQEIGSLVRTFRNTSTAPLLVHNMAQPRLKRAGVADLSLSDGQSRFVADLNRSLCQVAAEVIDVHLVDYAALVNYFGVRHWYDSRMRLYAKAPIASSMLGHLSQEYMRYFRALGGLNKKCLVVDLDNTLWGGIVGEDGIKGIQLGPNYPGNAFVEFQRVIMDLYRRGVLLAVASKNNPADVDAVFLSHPFMLLRKAHFSALEIHWNPKSDSLKRIATQLNLGLEHMVFADDNPAECDQVRRALPMVTVIQLPRQPEHFAEALCTEGLFDTLGLSAEDLHRGQLYQQRAQAETVRFASDNLEDYYRNLDMQLSLAPVDSASRARTAQLTQKTNQFNLTTIRYGEAELSQRMANPDWLLVTVGVRDRFGDNGIVGVMMAKVGEERLHIDTFLLSCRVIGRTVETAMLAFLFEAAQALGLKALRGRVVPSDKNMPARDLFEKHGFSKLHEDPGGTTSWEFDLSSEPVRRPAWFRMAA